MPVVTVTAVATFAGISPAHDVAVHDRCIPLAPFVATSRSSAGVDVELEASLEYPREPTVEQLALVAGHWRAEVQAVVDEFGATLHWDGLRARPRTGPPAGAGRTRR